ncbi:hypothetical protein PP742_gp70 [Alcaligenes phage vB_Af_QDWS595]|uniref:Uncharacterized protein n=1 Tax=Alcaligenes phage vB_Af_QDWS595 TaxID=2877946 RepID=A0AAE9BZY9_9CAUD|nr:hypothetical protein PP742_gp70 [Alcaligenes phage vB_Af_QDWS595]UCR75554.1 hypothetical protein vBAfaPQDWS595_70 [Alcaligenes phage vB_Af_QDWS595]
MNTKEKIEVMQAFLNGKTIQIFTETVGWVDWHQGADPNWNWDLDKFRIKPKTRYLNVYDYGTRTIKWKEGSRNSIEEGCIGYLEDKQDGSPIVFHKD